MDHFPLVTNSYHYVKLIQCSFRLLPVLVEMGIASLFLACLGGLEAGVRVWGWCGEEESQAQSWRRTRWFQHSCFHPWFQAKSHDRPASSTQANCWPVWPQPGHFSARHSSVFLYTRILRAFLVTINAHVNIHNMYNHFFSPQVKNKP